jgi:hypothetical protein
MSNLKDSPNIEKLLLPGMQVLLGKALEAEFEQQEAEFKRREAAFRERLTQIAGEIAVKVASAISYDSLDRVITIQMRLPK